MAAPELHSNIDHYDEPDTPLGIVLNTAAYIKVLDANPLRQGYKASNLSNNTILVVETTGGPPDNLDRGFSIWGRTVYESKPGTLSRGEIWMKALNGTPSILMTDE